MTFEFAALDFGAPAQHRYAVRLDGLNDGWLEAGARREATFTVLPPGRYTLQVRAAGRDGVWGAPSAPLWVVVSPPWWRAWWAYALYALAAGGLGVALVRYREGQRRLEQESKEAHLKAEALHALDRSRTAFFENVSHESRTPLTLTLGPLDDMPAPPPEPEADEDRTTVLVADDHADIRRYLRRHLEGAGYRVVEAADGQEALAAARERLPDLVVSDVMMPRLGGLGLCRALRADAQTRSIPVLMVSGETRAPPACADAFLEKPFNAAGLRAAIAPLLPRGSGG